MLLCHNTCGIYDGTSRRIITEDSSNLVVQQILVIYSSHLKCFLACHEGIFGFLRESHASTAIQYSFQYWTLHDTRQSRTESIVQPILIYSYSRFAGIQGVLNLIYILSEARPNTHTGYYYPSTHYF